MAATFTHHDDELGRVALPLDEVVLAVDGDRVAGSLMKRDQRTRLDHTHTHEHIIKQQTQKN